MFGTDKYDRIYQKLNDEQSRRIFDLRMDYMMNGNRVSFAKQMLRWYPNIQFSELAQFLEQSNTDKLCLIGDNPIALEMSEILPAAGFCVFHCAYPNEIGRTKEDYGYLTFDKSDYCALLKQGIPEKRILFRSRPLTGRLGWQYFDVFHPEPDEVFVDVGGYSGETSEDFVQWCHGDYRRIYIFEPNSQLIPKCDQRIRALGLKNVTLYPVAVCDKAGTEKFSVNPSFLYTSKLHPYGKTEVKTTSLDIALENEKPTFIKLDIEGAEARAIEGAKEILKKLHPKLSISAYHHPDDFFTLAEQVLRINPNYKLKLRHYHTDTNETVLYAYEDN